MKVKALTIIGVNILVLLGFLLLIEATGQVIALIFPSYDVLFLQPDEVVGWKQVPNFRWTWAGRYWYAADFSVEIETNPLGFRDIVRDFAKPPGVTRVAILGDSFIEAIQVPFAKTAAQLLEQRLDSALDRRPEHFQRWEVLNFGISNFGIGQYLLTWEQYASRFHPDYVAIFVAKFHMFRTINKYSDGPSIASETEKLWIRPTFGIEAGSLIREPAKDYDRFVKIQKDLIRAEFSGKRFRRKEMRLLTLYYCKELIRRLVQRFNKPSTPDYDSAQKKIGLDTDGELFSVNLKIIEELGQKVHHTGSKLVVVDVSEYFGDDQIVSKTLHEFCAEHGLGYIPLYKSLLEANRNGVSTRWAYDGHFNEAGNMILAQGLYDWIAQTANASESR